MSGVFRSASRGVRAVAAGLMIAFGGLQPQLAEGESAPPESRLRTVEYRADAVVPLVAYVGYHVHLEFAPDERFIALGSGDTSGLDIAAEANHLLLKPRQPNQGTNLTLLTNRRVYIVEYKALAGAPHPGDIVYSLKFLYPGEPGADNSMRDAPPGPPADSALPSARNTDYWYCGSQELRPLAADDDGIQVRLRFGAATELPSIYAATTDGEETLVSTHVENDTVVVHRLASRLVLRRGALVGCVTNRSAVAARRARTGTLDDGYERHTVGVDR